MGFQVGNRLIDIPARTLQGPTLEYGNKKQTPGLAQWNIKDMIFRSPGSIDNLNTIGLKGFSEYDAVHHAGQSIFDRLRSHGVLVNGGDTYMIDNYESGLRRFFEDNSVSAKDCTVVLLPWEENESSYSYPTIKRIADFYGRHVICVKEDKIWLWDRRDKIWKVNDQTASNLALKINMKFNGENHRLDLDLLNSAISNKDRKRTIVMGADVAHPSPGARDGCPSVASVVGSVDENFMRYQGSMRLQVSRQEKIEDMYSMVKELLSTWRENNGNNHEGEPKVLPTNILFYRDGVSESQFNICEEHEMNEIRRAYKDLDDNRDNSKLCLTFVVVVKRHHTRFYAKEVKDTYKVNDKSKGPGRQSINGNLKPGLLVTDVVTNPKPNNFFLQSHKALQGTARSTHYHILDDGMQLGMDRIPKLTHLLCYAFGRATTGVSYAAPAYIADRLCDRGMQYLSPWKDGMSNIDPQFRLSRDARAMTKEEITAEKQAFALKLNRWLVNDKTGKWHDGQGVQSTGAAPASTSTRLNPWNEDLDKGMFWL